MAGSSFDVTVTAWNAGPQPVTVLPSLLVPAGWQAAAEQGWKQFFHDPALQQLIQTALVNNRDLRVAALNIDAYAAQYQIQRADLFPAVSATGSGSRTRTPAKLSGRMKRRGTSRAARSIPSGWKAAAP